MVSRYDDFFGGQKETKMKLKDLSEDEDAEIENKVL
jgi:U3 small nucleolar RNA-associated protein MPP10